MPGTNADLTDLDLGPATRRVAELMATTEVISTLLGGLGTSRAVGFPVAGGTLERAIKEQLPVSCIVVVAKAP